jgi:holo-[acyl-carrier protein] synthase
VIAGVGIDVVELERFEAALRRQGRRFVERIFTAGERDYCESRRDRTARYAARFAAKEAVLKALGTGWTGGIRWTDVEVVRSPGGAVGVKLAGQARAEAKRQGVRTIHLSLTHTSRTAAAVAVAEK